MFLSDAWVRDAFEALRETLRVSTKTRNDMIQFLFDEGFWDPEKLTWDAAVARWNACLNPNKADAFFKLGELWALMKRFDRHHLFLAMAEDLGYEVRRRPTPERLQDLAEQLRDTFATIQGLQEQLASLSAMPATSAPLVRGSRPSFSRGDALP